MIDIVNLSIQFTGEDLFSDVNLKINRGDKIALVGSNGSGKSTFLKLLTGTEKPETGKLLFPRNFRQGYLPQDFLAFRGKSLFDEVKSSMENLVGLHQREEHLIEMLNAEDIEIEERNSILDELGEITIEKENSEFYSIDNKIEKVLIGLGFRENDFLRYTEEFSGGWQMRIHLAKILLGNNDLILLDEPTNHLDIDTVEWVTNYLINLKCAILLVSHDHYFINKVTSKTIEIYNKKVTFYNGVYDKYLRYKEERDSQLRSELKNKEKRIKEIESFVERFRFKASKARQVQSRIKMLDKIEISEVSEKENNLEMRFPPPPASGSVPIEVSHLSKYYSSLKVFSDINLEIHRGDKIAIIGPNGAGKTTFAKLIAGKIEPTSGTVKLGHNSFLSFFAQEATEDLNLENEIIDEVSAINEDVTLGQLRSLLGSFLFSEDDVFKKIKVLSGGEKSRVALAKLLLTKSNVIILDEPTNHLDVSSKAKLQKALINFQGTLLIVSHDIDFLNPIINKVLELRDCSANFYMGNLDYYFYKKKEQSENDKMIEEKTLTSSKETRKDQKRIEAEVRKKRHDATKHLKKKIDLIEEEIANLEELISTTEKELLNPEIFNNPLLAKEKSKLYESSKLILQEKMNNWEELTSQLIEIEESFNKLL